MSYRWTWILHILPVLVIATNLKQRVSASRLWWRYKVYLIVAEIIDLSCWGKRRARAWVHEACPNQVLRYWFPIEVLWNESLETSAWNLYQGVTRWRTLVRRVVRYNRIGVVFKWRLRIFLTQNSLAGVLLPIKGYLDNNCSRECSCWRGDLELIIVNTCQRNILSWKSHF